MTPTTTTGSSRELEVWAQAQTLRVALIAPPTAAVPAASLGGLEQVRWLAEGLAARDHQVALIGAGLGGITTGAYQVIDTDPAGVQRVSAEIVERLHAEQARKVLEQLDGVEVVSDHTRTGWQPTGHAAVEAVTVRTCYWPPDGVFQPAPRVAGHLGWVAVSEHQRRAAPEMGWVEVIHPGIPVGEHPLRRDHHGPCVYLGPLVEGHGAGLALEAAHRAGREVVLAGTQPSACATAYADLKLRPRLGDGDRLLESVSLLERWELLAGACCLVAPLHPSVAFSLEIVEAMAYGTPVVTTVGTVGAELVRHGESGLVVDDPALVATAIGRTARLDPVRVRGYAAGRFDQVGMVSAYEWLFRRLVGAQHGAAAGHGAHHQVPAGSPAFAAVPDQHPHPLATLRSKRPR